jgi:imidazoleglycerol-phosphate dehydratase / histidinol-phosphatase
MKKKILFIDRDGTLILEPPVTFQIDKLELLAFLPGAISYLSKIAQELDYALVMVSNQDGLGTASFPTTDFELVQNKMLQILAGENIHFSKIHVDPSFAHENKPGRKPGTAMLTEYFSEAYDLANSFVIGDRITDALLANNLGCQSLLLPNSNHNDDLTGIAHIAVKDWQAIYEKLKLPARTILHERNTNETKIKIDLNLDGSGKGQMQTGLGFFDHMLDQLARHGMVDLAVQVQGDLHIDEHHTIEDTGIALGEAFAAALGNKKGIERYAFALPMDDCLAQVALDFGGRSWLVWEASFKREKIGEMPTEMFHHFFKSFCDGAKANLNIKAEGDNEHHKIESIFKGFAKCIKQAVKRDLYNQQLPSTKGVL